MKKSAPECEWRAHEAKAPMKGASVKKQSGSSKDQALMSAENLTLTEANIQGFGLNENFEKKKVKKLHIRKLAKKPSPSEINSIMPEVTNVREFFSCYCED